jgi:GPH family glycoside/pentoside/hexuronide:cation symporter
MPSSSATTPLPEERLTAAQKTAFGLGFTGNTLMGIGIETMLFPVFALYLGLSPKVIGLAVALPRLWDGVMDTVIGTYSDNFKSRWGRRRPFIVAGAVASGLAYALIWMAPSGLGSSGLTAWLLVTLIVFWTANATFFVPLEALGMALSKHYDERTSLMGFRSFFAKVGTLASSWSFWLVEKGWFGTGQRGAVVVGAIWGLLIMVFGAWPGVFLRERTDHSAAPAVKFWHSLKTAVRNPSFRRITMYLLFMAASVSVSSAVQFYTTLFWVAQGDSKLTSLLTGAASTLNILCGMLSLPLVSWGARRIGKHRMALVAAFVTALGGLLSWWFLTPAHPWLSLAVAPFFGIGITAVYQLYFAMVADVAEEGALRHGVRNEGMYSAISNCMIKGGLALSFALGGALVDWLGFTGNDIHPTPEMLQDLRILRALLPTGTAAAAMLFVMGYPLTKERLEALRAQAARSA